MDDVLYYKRNKVNDGYGRIKISQGPVLYVT